MQGGGTNESGSENMSVMFSILGYSIVGILLCLLSVSSDVSLRLGHKFRTNMQAVKFFILQGVSNVRK